MAFGEEEEEEEEEKEEGEVEPFSSSSVGGK